MPEQIGQALGSPPAVALFLGACVPDHRLNCQRSLFRGDLDRCVLPGKDALIITLTMAATAQIDPDTERAARAFIAKVASEFDLAGAILFGSRARGSFRPESDADIAVLLQGVPGRRVDATLKMADFAFDVMLETGVLIEAIPLWEEEWEHPERFSNPALIENIRRDGVYL